MTGSAPDPVAANSAVATPEPDHLAEYWRLVGRIPTEAESKAEQLELQADTCEENPARQGMTQAEGAANAALLRQDAAALHREAVRLRRSPVRVMARRQSERRRHTEVRIFEADASDLVASGGPAVRTPGAVAVLG